MRARSIQATRFVRLVTAFLLGTLLFAGGSRFASGQVPKSPPAAVAPAAAEHRLPADVEQVIGWLPEDTESIIVTRGPFREAPKNRPLVTSRMGHDGKTINVYHDPTTGKEVPTPLELDFQQMSQEASLAGLDELGPAFANKIAKQKVRLVLYAGRRFRVASIIPCVTVCEFCELLWFEDAVPEVPFQPNAPNKLGLERIGENNVTRIDADAEPGKDSIYIVKPKPNILVLATDIGFLTTVLRQIACSPGSRTSLLDLPELKYVDASAPVWGIRHGHITFRNLPLRTDSVPKNDPTGIAFFYQKRPEESVALRWLQGSNADAPVTRVFGMDLRPIAPGVAGANLLLHLKRDADVPNKYRTSVMHETVSILMGYVASP